MANVGGHQLQQQLRKNQHFMNVNPSNELDSLDEENTYQDAVQNFEGCGPGPGSEHWLLEQQKPFFSPKMLPSSGMWTIGQNPVLKQIL